jgi:hypothetical protein
VAVVFIAGYLGMTAWCLYRQAIGDTVMGPVEMLFTWDMYPDYSTYEFRRSAIGLTKSGRCLQLVPRRMQGYRGGLFGDMSRLDHLPNADAVRARDFLRKAVEKALSLQVEAHREDPFVSVLLVEAQWPEIFNLPDDRFAAEYGRENPHRKRWRLVEQAAINKDGRPNWRSLP